MSKNIIRNSIWLIIAEGIKIYFSNIDKFLTYMLFPVFGQIIGIALAFGLSLGMAEKVVAKAQTPAHALLFVLLLALPGLLIFMKAFWDFLVAYVALNSMTEGALSTGKVYDFRSHNAVATTRVFNFIILVCAVGILSSLASSIFFIIPGFVLWIYFILVYQVFTFEPENSLQECFKKSFILVRGNWFRTFIILFILTFFSIYIITEGTTVIFDYLNISENIINSINMLTNRIPLDSINNTLAYFGKPIITPDLISKSIFFTILLSVVSGLTLPIRSICWTLWYMNLTNLNSTNSNSNIKRTRKPKREKVQEED